MNNTDGRPVAEPAGSGFIVVWDDQMGVCAPLGWYDDCEGALCCASGSVAVFRSRAAAKKAIDISARFAALRKAQGKPTNEDFIGAARRNLRLLRLIPNAKLSHGPAPTP